MSPKTGTFVSHGSFATPPAIALTSVTETKTKKIENSLIENYVQTNFPQLLYRLRRIIIFPPKKKTYPEEK